MSGGVESPIRVTTVAANVERSSASKRHRQPLKPNSSRSANPITPKRQKSIHQHAQRTKFHLGGSISDPLNLNGLMNAATTLSDKSVAPPPPRSDSVVNLILRPNIKDPLNLEGTYDLDHANLLSSEAARKKIKVTKDDLEVKGASGANLTRAHFDEIRKSIAKRRRAHSFTATATSASASVAVLDRQRSAPEGAVVEETLRLVDEKVRVELVGVVESERKSVVKIDEKPVVVQTEPKFEKNGFRFRFGNYNRYYGYRNPANEGDPRLDYLRSEWFDAKCVLDIGCNVGHVTLHIASTLKPSRIVGIDIDNTLVKAARNNIRHYMADTAHFPKSFAITYGGLVSHLSEAIEPSTSNSSGNDFPRNVQFIQGDYVPKSNDEVDKTECEYDFILALSITKWIHLNNGDEGIKRFFKKVYRNLKSGGSLLVEPQSWQSYKKKAKLSKEIWKTYHEINFRPSEFKNYLLSSEVGFAACKTIAIPNNKSKGFRRPMFLFTKQ